MNSHSLSRRTFLTSAAALAGTSPLWSRLVHAADPARPLIAYIGTFSSPLKDVLPTQVDLPPGNGRGIHLFKVDRSSGRLTEAGVYELGTSPSCLAVNAAATRLYSANETDRVGEAKEGTVSSFSINPADGSLTLLNTVRSGGAGPTYVSIHPAGRHLLVANYFGGSIAVLPIKSDGQLGEPTDVKVDDGPITPRQTISTLPPGYAGSNFCSEILVSQDGKFVYVGNRLHDSIGIFAVGANGELSRVADEWTRGNYPRSFTFDPTGQFLYCCNQRADHVTVFKADPATGKLAFTGQFVPVGNPSHIVFAEPGSAK